MPTAPTHVEICLSFNIISSKLSAIMTNMLLFQLIKYAPQGWRSQSTSIKSSLSIYKMWQPISASLRPKLGIKYTLYITILPFCITNITESYQNMKEFTSLGPLNNNTTLLTSTLSQKNEMKPDSTYKTCPIIATIGSYMEIFSWWVHSKSNDLLHFSPAYLKDSNQLLTELCLLGRLRYGKHVSTTDAKSMYNDIDTMHTPTTF